MRTHTLIAFVSLAGVAFAQLRGGDVVVTNFGGNTPPVFNVTPAGVATSLATSPAVSGASGLLVDRLRHAIVAEYSAGRILRIPAPGVVLTVATGVPSPIRMIEDENGEYLVSSLTTPPSILSVAPNGAVSTVWTGAPLVRPMGLDVDANGDILVADQSALAVFRLSRSGAAATLWAGPPLRLPQGVAIRNDGSIGIQDGLVDAIFLLTRGGSISILIGSPPLGNPDSVATDAQNGFWVAESGIAAGGFTCHCLSQISPFGLRTQLVGGAPFTNPEVAAAVPYLVPSGLPRVGQSVGLDWEVPQDGGLPYVLAAALSVHPGIGIPDGRAISLNLDLLFLVSVGANNSVFKQFIGVLDALGRATAGVNIPAVPALAGVDIYVQGVTASPGAPYGISTISNLIRLWIRP